MAELFDYDPDTGLTRHWDYDEQSGVATIHTSQDVSEVLRRNAYMRNTGAADKSLKKDDYFCKYASIPMVVVMELRKKGIDVFNEDHGKALMRELNTNYKWLKTTELTHDR